MGGAMQSCTDWFARLENPSEPANNCLPEPGPGGCFFLFFSPTFHCFFGLKDPDCLTDEASTSMITDTGHVNSQFSSCQSWYVPQAVKAAAEHWTKTVSNQLVSLCEADLNIKTQLTQFSLQPFGLSVRKYEDLISCHFITASVMQNDLFVVHLQVCVVWLQRAHSVLLPPCTNRRVSDFIWRNKFLNWVLF